MNQLKIVETCKSNTKLDQKIIKIGWIYKIIFETRS